jgi:hypothetical protein
MENTHATNPFFIHVPYVLQDAARRNAAGKKLSQIGASNRSHNSFPFSGEKIGGA